MLWYFMSENQLKKVWDYFDENFKREFIRLLKSLIDYLFNFVCIKKRWIKIIIYQLLITQHNN